MFKYLYRMMRAKGDLIMTKILKSVYSDESGATAIEYGLIAALVSIAAIAAFQSVGGALTNIFTSIAGHLNG